MEYVQELSHASQGRRQGKSLGGQGNLGGPGGSAPGGGPGGRAPWWESGQSPLKLKPF